MRRLATVGVPCRSTVSCTLSGELVLPASACKWPRTACTSADETMPTARHSMHVCSNGQQVDKNAKRPCLLRPPNADDLMQSRHTLRQRSSISPLYHSISPRQIALPRRSLATVKSLDCQTSLTGLWLGKRQKMTTAAAAATEQAAPHHAHNHQQKPLSYTAYEGNSWQTTLPATGRHCRLCILHTTYGAGASA